MSIKREIEATFGQRVYEYRDDDGVVYYSLTRAQSIISPPKRLKMKDWLGVHIQQFLVQFRRLSDSIQVDGDDG